MNEVYFPALFPGFALPEDLAEALERLAVVHAELDRETRTIRLDAQAEHYLAEKQLQSLCQAVEKQYGLKKLELFVRYPASELPNMDFRDLAQVFIRAFSPSAAILAGAGYEVTDEAVIIRLKANGKDNILQNAKKAEQFLRPDTLLILGLGLVAFIMDTAGGVLFAKFLNLFLKEKINPMIGAAGISAFPMSGRIVHKMGLKEDPSNFLLMHSIGVNVSGQIASVIAGGLILNFFLH